MTHNTLGEYQGLACHHHNEELPLIAQVLDEFRPSLVIETGTMHGGFAAFLADTVRTWWGTVLTIDIAFWSGLDAALADRPNLHFLSGDVFSPLVAQIIRDVALRAQGSLCFYADAGQGRPEFFQYGALAPLVGVHDYGTSADAEQCLAWAHEQGYVPVRQEAFAALQAQKGGYFVSRFWQRQP